MNNGPNSKEKIETLGDTKERNAHPHPHTHTPHTYTHTHIHTYTDCLDTHAKHQVRQRDHRADNTTNIAEVLIKTPERKSSLIAGALPSGNPLWIILSCNTEGNRKVAESLATPQHTPLWLHKDSVYAFNSQVTNQGQS